MPEKKETLKESQGCVPKGQKITQESVNPHCSVTGEQRKLLDSRMQTNTQRTVELEYYRWKCAVGARLMWNMIFTKSHILSLQITYFEKKKNNCIKDPPKKKPNSNPLCII